MFQRYSGKDNHCWKQLDEDIIYFQTDKFVKKSNLIIKNIQTDKMRQYFNIIPKTMGLLNKQSSQLNVFIKTSNSMIIAKLDKISLYLRTSFKICREFQQNQGHIYDFAYNFFLIFEDRQVYMCRNKLIRKYKGNPNKMENNIIMTMIFKSPYQLRLDRSLLEYFQIIFEKAFNIQIQELDQKYGMHNIRKIGDFYVLKRMKDYFQRNELHQVYYLNKDYVMEGQGKYGSFNLNGSESLKMMKCFDNVIYAVIEHYQQYNIYKITQERELIYSVDCLNHSYPILLRRHLVLTNYKFYFVPDVYEFTQDTDKLQMIQNIK